MSLCYWPELQLRVFMISPSIQSPLTCCYGFREKGKIYLEFNVTDVGYGTDILFIFTTIFYLKHF